MTLGSCITSFSVNTNLLVIKNHFVFSFNITSWWTRLLQWLEILSYQKRKIQVGWAYLNLNNQKRYWCERMDETCRLPGKIWTNRQIESNFWGIACIQGYDKVWKHKNISWTKKIIFVNFCRWVWWHINKRFTEDILFEILFSYVCSELFLIFLNFCSNPNKCTFQIPRSSNLYKDI